MYQDNKLWIGKSDEEKIYIYPRMANRHGMIAGATGTGKTVTLKVLAESFSDCGVPVFLADVKGDLAGICRKGEESDSLKNRIDAMGLREDGFRFQAYPASFWDIYGEKGLPLRATISEMGPLLLGRILELNETQSDILTVIFKIADDEQLLLLDTKDLRSMIQYVSENAGEYSARYGNLAKQSLGAIMRAVVALEAEGGEEFFGEPALNLGDFICRDCDGKGVIQVLDCQKLVQNPTMYSTFLLWMMSELFESLPEVGDKEKPKMVFFFDEAHLLFDSASKSLLGKIEQVVKLIRSKGVGIYFITQSPKDIPDGVLGQLGNKIQHALHAYTPSEQKAVRAAARSFRENPDFDTCEALTSLGIGEALTSLGIGEALVSVLDENGIPTVVKKCRILPPQSRMGIVTEEERKEEITGNLLYSRYSEMIDRESAYEILEKKVLTVRENKEREKREAEEEKQRQKEEAAAEKQRQKEEAAADKQRQREEAAAERQRLKEEEAARKAAEKKAAEKDKKVKSAVKKAADSAAGTIGREVGNSIGKSLGGSFGKKLGGNVGASLGRGILSTLFKS